MGRIRKAVADRRRKFTPRRVRLRRRVRRALHGRTASIISSNCVGGRISELAGDPYHSPTVGLRFDPASFVEFVSDLPRYLGEEIVEDAEESRRLGYPVGRMGEVTVQFMHSASFVDAVEHWRRRADRVRLDDVVVVYVDEGDAGGAARFAALPLERKVMVTTRTDFGDPFVVAVPPDPVSGKIGDLYDGWDRLAPVLGPERIGLFRCGA